MALTRLLPWWLKVAGKLVLSRLPVDYRSWERLGLFKHGRMEDPAYAVGVFEKHFGRVDFARKEGGFVALELGPGDSVSGGVVAHAHGAAVSYLVDAGRFARDDVETYRSMLTHLQERGFPHAAGPSPDSFDDLLDRFGVRYLTAGLASLKDIPDETVDLIWSNAVYEHIRLDDIEPMTRELRRVLRPDGACSHTIDLKDHLGGRANHLRFPAAFWESPRVASAGFYTNRLRCSQLLAVFRAAGFDVQVLSARRWPQPPIGRSEMAQEFRAISDDDLLISDLDVVLRPR